MLNGACLALSDLWPGQLSPANSLNGTLHLFALGQLAISRHVILDAVACNCHFLSVSVLFRLFTNKPPLLLTQVLFSFSVDLSICSDIRAKP